MAGCRTRLGGLVRSWARRSAAWWAGISETISAPRPTSTTGTEPDPPYIVNMAHFITSPEEDQTILSSDHEFSVRSSESPLTVQFSAPPPNSPAESNIRYAIPGTAMHYHSRNRLADRLRAQHHRTYRFKSLCELYLLNESSSEHLDLLETQVAVAQAMLRLAEATNKKTKEHTK